MHSVVHIGLSKFADNYKVMPLWNDINANGVGNTRDDNRSFIHAP